VKYWTTKYALTIGIKVFEYDREPRDGCYIYPRRPHDIFQTQFRIGVDAFTTREDAIKAAEEMRKKKIASLRRSIDRIEALNFDLAHRTHPKVEVR
jgi:hypothetical protein